MAIRPSMQQEALLDAFADERDIIVRSGPGTGKTTSAVMMSDSQPDLSGLYLAYNRAVADEARERFHDGVAVRTAHGLAHRWARKAIPGLLGKMDRDFVYDHVVAGQLYPRATAVTLKIVTEKSTRSVGPLAMSRMALATVNSYLSSDDAVLEEKHFGRPESYSEAVWASHARSMLLDHVMTGAERALDDLFSTRGTLVRFDHAAYLKLFALDEASEDLAKRYDYIMIDEAQDMTPVIADIVLRQQGRTQIVAIGDPFQQIMGWAGARNAIPRLIAASPNAVVLPLSESYRFGPEVAERANRITAALSDPTAGFDEPAVVTGLGEPTEVRISPPISVAGGLDATTPDAQARFAVDAVLVRTNAGAIVEALAAVSAGVQPVLKVDTKALHSFFSAAVKLQAGKKANHPAMDGFSTWAEFKEFVEANSAAKAEYGLLMRLATSHGAANMERLLSTVENPSRRGHRVLISTAHRVKGLEWDRVRLGDDFAEIPDDEELMLLYVAITRGRTLMMPGSMWPLTEHGVAMSEIGIIEARASCRLTGAQTDAQVLADQMAVALRRAGKAVEGDLPGRLVQAAAAHLARRPVSEQERQNPAPALRLVPSAESAAAPIEARPATAPRRPGRDDVEVDDGKKVMRWKKYAHHRLYVSDPADERLGWGDVKTGVITSASDLSKQDLRSMLEQHVDWAPWVDPAETALSVVR